MSSISSSSALSSAEPIASGAQSAGGANGNNNDNSGGSSASNLYLYTFLATLVLLVVVSTAVIIRSVMYRIRARRALELAIRNGTYNPPSGMQPIQSDTKPTFYDAYLKEGDRNEKGFGFGSIQPVAMAFSVPTDKPILPSPVTSPGNAIDARTNAGSIISRLRSRISSRLVFVQDFIDEVRARDIHSRIEAQRQQEPSISQAELASAVFKHQTATGERERDADAEKKVVRPDAVCFAVLVAMPDASKPSCMRDVRDEDQDRESDVSSSTSSLKGKGRALVAQREVEEEREVPYIEFGVAEVGLSPG